MKVSGVGIWAVSLLFLAQLLCAQVRVITYADFSSSKVLLNFDELPTGVRLTNEYQSKGVLFDSALVESHIYAVSPPNALHGNPAGLAPTTLRFLNGAKRVGIQCDADGFVGGRQPQMRVFDRNGTLLGTQNCQGPLTQLALEVTTSELIYT